MEDKHTPGPAAELNKLGFWVPVIYYPHRAEVGNAQYTKERAMGIAEMMWEAALRNWRRDADANILPVAPDYAIKKRDAARAAIRIAEGNNGKH